MAEPIEIAVQQCFVVLGQYSVNQLVMFLSVLILFCVIIGLAIYINKLQYKIQGLREEFLKAVATRKKEKDKDG